MATKLQELSAYGQSVWLDYISRPLLETGKLDQMISDGLRGMTSNPSIFNQAIGASTDYDTKISALKQSGKSAFEIYDALTIKDIQDATDKFSAVYQETNKLDGYVSLEINPLLADKIDLQIAEGVRLFKDVARSNVMIKVPATSQGFVVVEELIAQGINVNVTLIFSLTQYEQTAAAYLKGLTRLAAAGGDLRAVHSVASVFVSRTDSAIDALLEKRAVSEAASLQGRAAVANCHLMFAKFQELFQGFAFEALAAQGANAQRVLWASTSTKNPTYPDVKYVSELIAAPTVNTIPANTLEAFIDHGKVTPGLTGTVQEAQQVIDQLKGLNIDLETVCAQLLSDGLAAFNQAFETLLASVETKAAKLSTVA